MENVLYETSVILTLIAIYAIAILPTYVIRWQHNNVEQPAEAS